ncbi:MAG: undecaprenyl-phosphate glucose phosphotransferase [Myxococcota bacterium]
MFSQVPGAPGGEALLRRYSEVFRTLCAFADLGLVALAWAGAYWIRFHWDALPAAPAPPQSSDYLVVGLGLLPVWALLMSSRGLYAPRRGRSRREEARKLIEVSTLGTLLLAAGTFFWHTPISRLVIFLFWGISVVGLGLFRASLRTGLAALRRRGLNQRRVLIVGTGMLARAVYERFRDHPEAGFRVIGFVGSSAASLGPGLPPTLGSLAELHEVATRHEVDQVVIALDRGDPADPLKLVHELNDSTAAVRLVPDLLGLQTLQAGIEDFDGLPMIRLVETPLVGWNQLLKRGMDCALALAALLLAAPLLGAIALAIRSTSPGAPVLYRQQRMGLDGRLFKMLKFRTMVPDAEAETGPRWAVRDDPRRTRLGALLRRYSVDELPQLWNVLRGEMSLVGPRPERPEFIAQFRRRMPGYMLRHKMKAGMTGWAQVNGCRGNTSIEKRLEYDLEYARRWSLLLDLRILLLTFVRLRDPNAY